MNEAAIRQAPAYTQIRVREPAGQRAFDESLSIGGEDAQIVVPGVPSGSALRVERRGAVWVAIPVSLEVRHNGRVLAGPAELRAGDVLVVGDAHVGVDDVSRTLLQIEVAHRLGNATIAPMGAVAAIGDATEDDEILIRPAGAYVAVPGSARKPADEATSRAQFFTRSRTVWGGAIAALLLLALLGVISALEPVTLDLAPTDAAVRTPGTLISWRSADRILVLPGEHTLRGEAPGYVPAEARVTVVDNGHARAQLRLEKEPGELNIDTGGIAAELSIDGAPAGRVPGVVQVAAGHRTLTLRAPRHLEFATTLEVEGKGERQDVRVRLQPNWGTLRITAVPQTVNVTVDGTGSGTTPAALELQEGVRRVQLAAEGLKTWETTLVVKPGQVHTIGPIRLGQPDARLAVRSTPAGANVTVGGAYRGRTPVDIELPPGMSHEVAVTLPGHTSWAREIFAQPDARLAMDARLEPVLGRVAIRGSPEDAEIRVDGTPRGTAPQTLDLSATQHRIEIRKEGFQPYTATVVPAKGLERVVEYRLVSTDRATALAEENPTITTKIGYVLRFVPPGKFTMGSERREQGRRPNEGMRQVTLKRPFYLGVTEVTNGQFRKFRPSHASGFIEKQTLDLDNHPASKVTWQQAAAFCNWLSEQEGLELAYEQREDDFVLRQPVTNGYRLPTEAEWEYAARYAGSGKQTRYAWGDALPVPANVGNVAGAETGDWLPARFEDYRDDYQVVAPVGQFAASPLGLHDMTGNVSEWVNDFYLSFVAGAASVDPLGPAAGNRHAIRGSSWRSALASELRYAWRDSGDDGNQAIGFRVARYAD
jgi:formylglycine-generating enzyme required for sulfatase activity